MNSFGKVALAIEVQNPPLRPGVVRAGDSYEGMPVSSVFTRAEALNDLGQIVMSVQRNPGTFEVRTFIVKATPRRR